MITRSLRQLALPPYDAHWVKKELPEQLEAHLAGRSWCIAAGSCGGRDLSMGAGHLGTSRPNRGECRDGSTLGSEERKNPDGLYTIYFTLILKKCVLHSKSDISEPAIIGSGNPFLEKQVFGWFKRA